MQVKKRCAAAYFSKVSPSILQVGCLSMKKIFGYVYSYFLEINKTVLLLSSILVASLIFFNYRLQLNDQIGLLPAPFDLISWYVLFLLVFAGGYFFTWLAEKQSYFRDKSFLALLLLAPALFAWKMTANFYFEFSNNFLENIYWNDVVYWPLKVCVITLVLYALHRGLRNENAFFGVTFKNFKAAPYAWMLLIMVPLIAAASTQEDFLKVYPKFQNVAFLTLPNTGWEKLLYEISYGSDFFSIELFFRGFLVLGFAKWAGKHAILPMAMFYCLIHFGKPLGECISSFFGGLILGVVSYRTQNIMGGFFVHVGIAWLMELGGYLGHQFT